MALTKKRAESFSAEGSLPPGFEKFRTIKTVTMQSWPWEAGETKAFRVTSEIHKGREIIAKTADKQKMKPADVCNVVDLVTKTPYQLVLGAVLKSDLEENYPNASYVGKCFVATKIKAEGKRYFLFTVREIADPEA